MRLQWVAISMLIGDRVKFFALIFGVAFATLLMAQQSSFCVGLLSLSGNFVRDIREADLWVMREGTVSVESALPMPSTELFRVRGVAGVDWAMPLFKGAARVRVDQGGTQSVSVIGVDDVTLLGAPQTMIQGRFEDLRQPDGIFMNRAAYKVLFPGQPEQLGATLELNDRRAVLVGIVATSPGFATNNLVFTRYANAVRFVPSGRNTLSFVLVKAAASVPATELSERITQATGRKATPRLAFVQQGIDDVIQNSGIVPGFAVVVILGCIVGVVIVALTLSLFIRDNIKALGALKAIGVPNTTLVAMVLTQALMAALIGFGLGIGGTAWLLESAAKAVPNFSTFYLPWQVMAACAVAVTLMTLGAALASVRRVLKTDPAIVFR
jgi:putative ABC transport system permease protein